MLQSARKSCRPAGLWAACLADGCVQEAESSASRFPFVISGSDEPIVEWLARHRDRVKEGLAAHGAVLLRNFRIRLDDLRLVASGFADIGPMAYEHGSTPRTRVGEFTYTSTEYPARAKIAQHCECSYQTDWPTILFFYCNLPSPEGGCTPIASLSAVTARLPPGTVAEFERKGVMYVRNYYPELEPTWQSAFGTSDKAAVEAYCQTHGLSYRWTDDDCLSTTQRCQGIIDDPATGEKLWFNQAHLFHPSALDPDIQEALLEIYAPAELPRTAFFGDGSDLDPDLLAQVRAAFEMEERRFDWRPGDVLILDNIRVSHGRDPYAGAREIYVAMADLWSETAGRTLTI
jgi:alpha-ketoglutarate-dependent taurine dioxygenase